MAAGKMRFMVLLMATSMMLLQVSMATVYKVGDEPGWTTMGNVDYQKWSSSKTFRVGDVICKSLLLLKLLILLPIMLLVSFRVLKVLFEGLFVNFSIIFTHLLSKCVLLCK